MNFQYIAKLFALLMKSVHLKVNPDASSLLKQLITKQIIQVSVKIIVYKIS